MPKTTINEAAIEALASELSDDQPSTVVESHASRWKKGWRPKLNPTQLKAANDPAIFLLMDGERGSGKTVGALHMLVEHCYVNPNAFGLILVKEVSQATDGGAWYKLNNTVLPVWQHGNIDRDGKRLDSGLGDTFQFTESKLDAQTKKPYIWLRNIDGGWSMIMLISLPFDSHVTSKVKGKEPSFIVVDEAQTLESDAYFGALIQQVGRRPGIKTKQKVIYCANPDGPSHWLYKRFFVLPLNEQTGEWDVRYARYHVPVQENLQNLPDNYYEDYVIPAVKSDPIEEARMVRGEWVDRPTGEALFKDIFSPSFHVRGDVVSNKGIIPVKGHEILVGYDLGAAHTSIHFLQCVPTKDKIYWLVIDELNYVGQYIPYVHLVPKIIARMNYWNSHGPFQFKHISDNSAFNQFRAATGSFDAWDIEEISKGEIKLIECPKGPHSVEARVRMLRDKLQQEELLVSATCIKTIEMFNRLEEDQEERLKPKRSPYIHVFDSLTYPMFYFHVGKGRFALNVATDRVVTPQVYAYGRA